MDLDVCWGYIGPFQGANLASAHPGLQHPFGVKLPLGAAGIALPLLGLFGYAPGARDAAALQALTVVYCLLPCVLKLLAAGLLHTLWIRGETR